MKLSEQSKHLHQFQLQFMNLNTTDNKLNQQSQVLHTEENMVKEEPSTHIIQKSKPQEKQPQNIKKKKYKFRFWKYALQSMVAVAITIGLMFLLRVAPFPYFQTLFVGGMFRTIKPLGGTGLLIMFCSICIFIVNYYLNVRILSYPSAVACYISVYFFKEKHKRNILWVVVFAVYVGCSFIIGGIYNALTVKYIFYYIFPLIILFMKVIVALLFWVIDKSNLFCMELSLFQAGLFVGIILTNASIHSIQFWYLIVFFTLSIVNDRSQFILRILKNCFSKYKQRPGILPAHASGYNCLQSFHLMAFVYMVCYFDLYSSPYTKTTVLSKYVTTDWRLPLIVFAFSYMYEFISLLLMKRKETILIIGFESNGWVDCVERTVMLILGLWIYYVGLGIGAHLVF